MDEFSFIDSIKQKTYSQSSLIKGIGDDAAVFRSSMDIVTAVDTFVENVHFSKETMNSFHVGYRALAANISDLAAMGAVPAFYLVSIVIPKGWEQNELVQIFDGMKQLAEQYKMDLIGGDTVSGKELSISITVLGYTMKDKSRFRSDSIQGDVVFVTGTLGDSQAGFHVLTNPDNYIEPAYFVNKHRMPSPRVDFSSKLNNISRLALNDISDGIASEANEIAEASSVTITLVDELLPTSTNFNQFPADLQYKWKLYGGEDFELMGTVSKEEWNEVKRIAELTNTMVSKIGYVSAADPVGRVFLKQNHNKDIILEKKGYVHLK
ncbi:thiamine-phosphate kinase [Oceanobacillus longus]|uniref:Thiamine-monophosphate kinase n=1 Tax=Oceanobacillus longus TaxID=930120 RepID=A0ABV8H5E1_9BACI